MEPSAASTARTPIAEWIGDWYVASCRPKFERQFVAEMQAEGIQAYCPTELLVRRDAAGQRRTIERVLWDRYAFFVGDASARYAAAISRCTSTIIEVRNQTKFIKQLSNVADTLAYDPFARSYSHLAVGMRCCVKQNHPLRGKEGIVIEADEHKAKFILQIEMLGAGVSLEIDPAFLEPV